MTQAIEKRKAREQKEIARLERDLGRPKPKAYLLILLLVVSLVYIADEVASQIEIQMQSEIAHFLFAPIYGEENAVGMLNIYDIITYVGVVIGLFYRPLSDRYGRKLFLVLNTLGMGIGLFTIFAANNIAMFVLGSTLLTFFTPYDMQVVYISESAPAKHRAKIYSAVKSIATLGVMAIPLFRMMFMDENAGGWHNVFLAAAVMTFAAALLALLFTRETDPFIKSRLEYLRKTDEEREADQKAADAKDAQGSLKAAFKLCFHHKQILFSILGLSLVMSGITMTTYYTITMTYGYASIYTAQGIELGQAKELASGFVTQALILFPVGSTLPQFFQGFISDRIGRRWTTVLMSSTALISYAFFLIGANLTWSPYLVGLLCGMGVGANWAAGDSMNLLLLESTPTNQRSSIMTVNTLAGIIYTLFQAIQLILINVLGDSYAGILSIVIAAPPIIAGLILIITKVKETKGVRMDAIDLV